MQNNTYDSTHHTIQNIDLLMYFTFVGADLNFEYELKYNLYAKSSRIINVGVYFVY